MKRPARLDLQWPARARAKMATVAIPSPPAKASSPTSITMCEPGGDKENKPAAGLQLQVRSLDPTVFHISTEASATILSIKQSIMTARGIDVIMQKLICKGALLQDDARVEECNITENDFLVLVTAKPRPPSLVSTGAPLPSSYQTHLHGSNGGIPGADEGDDEGDEHDGQHDLDVDGDEGGEEEEDGDVDGVDGVDGLVTRCDAADAAEGIARLVEMGYDSHDAEQALRIASNDSRRALALLRSGRLDHLGDEAVRLLQDRLRSLPAFHALQQVVRVDPQIMLVLNVCALAWPPPPALASRGLHPQPLPRVASTPSPCTPALHSTTSASTLRIPVFLL